MGNGFLVYIISQIFITCALGLQGGTYFITNRHRQLVVIILSNTCSAICFFLLGGYVAVAMNIIAIARDVTSHVIYARRAPGDADKITRTDCWLLALWNIDHTCISVSVFFNNDFYNRNMAKKCFGLQVRRAVNKFIADCI